ncbi:ATP-binding response regulator [Pedobacter sp. NJ-S-72]
MLYLILTDITKSNLYRKELEAARDEAEYHGMAKQRFLSNMSHEIRTPLQSIIGYAEIIRHQEHPKLKDINAIYHSSEHLLQIVNEILDYNRIISGKFTFQQKPFNIRELLEEVITIMKPQAEQKKLKMQTEIELHGVDFVEGDAFRLKQILYNLLSNAIKFTQTGEVLLSVFYKRQSDNLHFTFMVKDTGIGLTEEESSRIFNEFEQIDSPDKEVINKAGAGLGLTILKSLVENQDGRIYVKSKPAVGSTFTVYLTFKIADVPVESNIPQISEKIYVKDKVWVVDDDQLILDLCQIIFTKKHIDHLCFNSPADLLAAVWDPKVKYILMDMRMPEISGAELCRLMKAKIPADVKIYAMTAQVLPEELESVLKQGFDGLIMKPFRENDLLAVFSTTVLAEEEEISDTADFSGIGLDTSVVEKMTFGDQELLLKILNRFKEDCVNDMAELQQSIIAKDQPLARLIVHRIAGRTAQMGSGQLASEFRMMEIDLSETVQEIDSARQEKLELLIKRLSLLMQLVDQKIS